MKNSANRRKEKAVKEKAIKASCAARPEQTRRKNPNGFRMRRVGNQTAGSALLELHRIAQGINRIGVSHGKSNARCRAGPAGFRLWLVVRAEKSVGAFF